MAISSENDHFQNTYIHMSYLFYICNKKFEKSKVRNLYFIPKFRTSHLEHFQFYRQQMQKITSYVCHLLVIL